MTHGSAVPSGHVRLILTLTQYLYLEIPLTEIDALCLSPRKYLAFLAWCILGVEGGLAKADRVVLDPIGPLHDKCEYYYVSNGHTITDLSHAVDLKVVKEGASELSETTETRDAFCNKLLERDGQCVFTGTEAVGMHIIPFKCGSEWFRRIVQNRPHDNDNVGNLRDINDIRNGMLAVGLLHNWFDARGVAILKTPNRYLNRTDIPPRVDRLCPLPVGAAYPLTVHYTMQWLGQPAPSTRLHLPNNSEAAFISGTGKPRPSGFLLNYYYGATA